MIFTLGHSTLSQAEFADAAKGVDVIVDVRSHPMSSHVPHFNQGALEQWLPKHGLTYEWWGALGGWCASHLERPGLREQMAAVDVDIAAYARGAFPKDRIASKRSPAPDAGPEWTSTGLRDYAYYTALPEFQSSIDWLCALFSHPGTPSCALVCSEAQWWRCHRSMIADCLTYRNVWVAHLPSRRPKRAATRRFTVHSEVLGNRLQRYPTAVLETWASLA